MRAEHINTVSLAPRPDNTEETLVMAGRLVRGDGADWTIWWSLVASMPHGVVTLDLSAVTAIDAAGAGLLARLAVHAWCHGRELRIVAASARVRRVLALVGLDTVLAGVRSVARSIDCATWRRANAESRYAAADPRA